MALREEILERTNGHDYEEPEGEFLTLVSEKPDKLVVLTRVDDSAASSSDDTEETDYPTNEDGEPLCVGKEDGQCSRVVEEADGTCWQHDEDQP